MPSIKSLSGIVSAGSLSFALITPGCGKAFDNGCWDTLTCSQGADGGTSHGGRTGSGGTTSATGGTLDTAGVGASANGGAPIAGAAAAGAGGQAGGGGSAGAPSVCGNGKQETGEACDNGNENGNYASCLPSCAHATCGDGHLWDGEEECDYNEPSTASTCARSCKSSIWALWPMPNASPDLPNKASYDVSAGVTVLDKVTGLIWQRAVSPASYTWTEAKAYCTGLTLAGYSDWRLPTRIELVSLVTSDWNPSIDRDAFPSTPAVEFWTSSPVAAFPSTAWVVEFSYATTQGAGMSSALRVRCVR